MFMFGICLGANLAWLGANLAFWWLLGGGGCEGELAACSTTKPADYHLLTTYVPPTRHIRTSRTFALQLLGNDLLPLDGLARLQWLIALTRPRSAHGGHLGGKRRCAARVHTTCSHPVLTAVVWETLGGGTTRLLSG